MSNLRQYQPYFLLTIIAGGICASVGVSIYFGILNKFKMHSQKNPLCELPDESFDICTTYTQNAMRFIMGTSCDLILGDKETISSLESAAYFATGLNETYWKTATRATAYVSASYQEYCDDLMELHRVLSAIAGLAATTTLLTLGIIGSTFRYYCNPEHLSLNKFLDKHCGTIKFYIFSACLLTTPIVAGLSSYFSTLGTALREPISNLYAPICTVMSGHYLKACENETAASLRTIMNITTCATIPNTGFDIINETITTVCSYSTLPEVCALAIGGSEASYEQFCGNSALLLGCAQALTGLSVATTLLGVVAIGITYLYFKENAPKYSGNYIELIRQDASPPARTGYGATYGS